MNQTLACLLGWWRKSTLNLLNPLLFSFVTWDAPCCFNKSDRLFLSTVAAVLWLSTLCQNYWVTRKKNATQNNRDQRFLFAVLVKQWGNNTFNYSAVELSHPGQFSRINKGDERCCGSHECGLLSCPLQLLCHQKYPKRWPFSTMFQTGLPSCWRTLKHVHEMLVCGSVVGVIPGPETELKWYL